MDNTERKIDSEINKNRELKFLMLSQKINENIKINKSIEKKVKVEIKSQPPIANLIWINLVQR